MHASHMGNGCISAVQSEAVPSVVKLSLSRCRQKHCWQEQVTKLNPKVSARQGTRFPLDCVKVFPPRLGTSVDLLESHILNKYISQ